MYQHMCVSVLYCVLPVYCFISSIFLHTYIYASDEAQMLAAQYYAMPGVNLRLQYGTVHTRIDTDLVVDCNDGFE
jgi:hypothetical protein